MEYVGSKIFVINYGSEGIVVDDGYYSFYIIIFNAFMSDS